MSDSDSDMSDMSDGGGKGKAKGGSGGKIPGTCCGKMMPRGLVCTRIAYAILLGVCFVIALLLRDGIFGALDKWNAYKYTAKPWWENKFGATLTGFHSVHRVSFALVIYFLIHLLLSFPGCCGGFGCARVVVFLNANPCFTVFKIIGFLIFLGLTFFIPDSVFVVQGYGSIVMSAIFHLCQVLILIESTFKWHEWILKKSGGEEAVEDEDAPACTPWMLLELGLSIGAWFLSLSLFGGEVAVFCVGGDCHLQRVWVIMTFFMGLIVSILSPLAQLGTLPGAAVAFYMTILCWSSLVSGPRNKDIVTGVDPCNMFSTYVAQVVNATGIATVTTGGSTWGRYLSMAFTIGFCMFSLIYSAISGGRGIYEALMCCGPSGEKEEEDFESMDDQEKGQYIVKLGAKKIVEGLLVFILSSFFLGTVLTNWEVVTQSSDWTIGKSWTAMVIKFVAECVCFVLFTWACIWLGCIQKKVEDKYEDEGGCCPMLKACCNCRD